MTAALHRVAEATSAEQIAAALCPSDPSVVIEGFRWALFRAMKPRANGTRHLDSCRNARVNAQWFECQKECEYAQILLVWGDVWRERNRGAESGRDVRGSVVIASSPALVGPAEREERVAG